MYQNTIPTVRADTLFVPMVSTGFSSDTYTYGRIGAVSPLRVIGLSTTFKCFLPSLREHRNGKERKGKGMEGKGREGKERKDFLRTR